jgi:hypothetical protein
VALLLGAVSAHAATVDELIQQAGNGTDEVRLEALRAIAAGEPALADDANRLAREIERWLGDPKLDYFGAPARDGKPYDFGIAEESPLYPLTHLYQARMFLWATLEYGGYWKEPDVRRTRYDLVRSYFERAAKAFPGNSITAMYLGTPIPPAKIYEVPGGAPEWAVQQREGLERLADIVEWWIDHRMQPTGAYGGGWGDDCEMWRWWVPVLIAFDDPKIVAAQAKFSEAIMSQEHMRVGYTAHMSDVEHTAEDSADAVTPMMHLERDREEWKRLALKPAELMETLWTGINERGQLQFKSTYFTATEVDGSAKRACDTVYHPRTVQAALVYWQRTNDARLGKLFSSWMDTWVDATARAERGKPAGIVPSAIHWPDGRIGGVGEHWWDPENHNSDPLYVWPSAMPLMTNTLLLTHYMTGDGKYLEPLRTMAAARLRYLQAHQEEPEPGSEAWCAERLVGLAPVLAKYRLLTGSTEFDEILTREKAAYVRYVLDSKVEELVPALRANAEALRINFPGYTSEVRYTDRVLRLPSVFEANGMFPEVVAGIEQPDPQLLYSTATGDPGDGGYFPMSVVRWRTPPRDIAALVTGASRERFEARLYHFGEHPRDLRADLFLIKPGAYRLTLTPDEGKPAAEEKVVATAAVTPVRLILPPRASCTLRVQPE